MQKTEREGMGYLGIQILVGVGLGCGAWKEGVLSTLDSSLGS